MGVSCDIVAPDREVESDAHVQSTSTSFEFFCYTKLGPSLKLEDLPQYCSEMAHRIRMFRFTLVKFGLNT